MILQQIQQYSGEALTTAICTLVAVIIRYLERKHDKKKCKCDHDEKN
jgi:hypothetical protein